MDRFSEASSWRFRQFFLQAQRSSRNMKEKKKQAAGISQTIRGRQAAGLDARGAAMGSVGLVVFAVVVWRCLPTWNSAATLVAALAAWFTVSFLIWRLRKQRIFFRSKSS